MCSDAREIPDDHMNGKESDGFEFLCALMRVPFRTRRERGEARSGLFLCALMRVPFRTSQVFTKK